MSKGKTCSCPVCGHAFAVEDGVSPEERLIAGFISLYAKHQKEKQLPCPRCGENSMRTTVTSNALSRVEDIYICDACGIEEAMCETFRDSPKPVEEWVLMKALLNIRQAGKK